MHWGGGVPSIPWGSVSAADSHSSTTTTLSPTSYANVHSSMSTLTLLVQGESGSQYGLQPQIKMLSYSALTETGEFSHRGIPLDTDLISSLCTEMRMCPCTYTAFPPTSLLTCFHSSPPLHFEKNHAARVVGIFLLHACVIATVLNSQE